MELLIKRAMAFVADMIILSGIYVPIALLLTDDAEAMAHFAHQYLMCAGVLMLLRDVPGRSPGKKLLGLELLDEQGRRPVLWKRIVRNFTLPLFQIETLAVAFSSDHQRFSDRLLHLRVTDWSHRFPRSLRR